MSNDPMTDVKIEVAVVKQQVADLKTAVEKLDSKSDKMSSDLKVEIEKQVGKVFKVFYWFLTAGGAVVIAKIIQWIMQGNLRV